MIENDDLRKIQLLELDILKEVKRICEKYKIEYFIIGGTLLGAIRHKGFIPWDDDIDVAIPRHDYDRFIDILAQELIAPMDYLYFEKDVEYREYSLKIINKNVVVYENKNDVEKSKTNLWIDILPIDGVPDNTAMFNLHKLRVYVWKALLSIKNIKTIKNKKRNIFEQIIIKIAQIIPRHMLISQRWVMKKLDNTIRSYSYMDCINVGTFMGAYRFKEVVPKELFGKGTDILFEGSEFKAPEKIDTYLKHMYGNYMELPPLDKRITHINRIEFVRE